MNGLYSRSVVWNLIGLLFLSGGTILIAQEKITVRKMGNDFVVRSEFSPEYDLVLLNYRYANEGAYLLPKNIPLKDYNRTIEQRNKEDTNNNILREAYMLVNNGKTAADMYKAIEKLRQIRNQANHRFSPIFPQGPWPG